jgi:hypothetical protein
MMLYDTLTRWMMTAWGIAAGLYLVHLVIPHM